MATGRTTIGGDWDGSVDGGKPGGHGGVTLQAEVHANDGCGRLGWRSEPRLWPRRLNRTTIHDMIAAGRCMTFSACFSPAKPAAISRRGGGLYGTKKEGCKPVPLVVSAEGDSRLLT